MSLFRELWGLDPVEHKRQRHEVIARAVAVYDETHPSARPGRRPAANLERAHVLFPSVDFSVPQWMDRFSEPDHVWAKIIHDLVKNVRATDSEVRKTGRRPEPKNVTLREVEGVLARSTSMKPFPEALRVLFPGQSLRRIAMRLDGVHTHKTLSRLMVGESPLSKGILETIARAGKVEPHYFVEYRRMVILEQLGTMLDANPMVSMAVYHRVAP